MRRIITINPEDFMAQHPDERKKKMRRKKKGERSLRPRAIRRAAARKAAKVIGTSTTIKP